MKNLIPAEELSETTRKTRTTLLVLSLVCEGTASAGLIPTKISALGLELSYSDQTHLLSLLGASVLFLTLQYALYAVSDVIYAKRNHDMAAKTMVLEAIEKLSSNPETKEHEATADAVLEKLNLRPGNRKLASWLLGARLALDVFIPLLWGFYVFCHLITSRIAA